VLCKSSHCLIVYALLKRLLRIEAAFPLVNIVSIVPGLNVEASVYVVVSVSSWVFLIYFFSVETV
jgi:hypothetical protein